MKNSQWYEDVTTFRSTARDLEVRQHTHTNTPPAALPTYPWPVTRLLQLMLGNIIGGAFDVAATLCLKLEVLEAFYRTATREGLRRVPMLGSKAWRLPVQT